MTLKRCHLFGFACNADLLRRKLDNGRYESCQPHHLWNSDQLFSNWPTFHQQRHSDHHAHPVRRNQSLRHFDDVPQLPNDYFGMFVVAYIPPRWFWMMDRRLPDAVGWAPERINFDPKKRDKLWENIPGDFMCPECAVRWKEDCVAVELREQAQRG